MPKTFLIIVRGVIRLRRFTAIAGVCCLVPQSDLSGAEVRYRVRELFSYASVEISRGVSSSINILGDVSGSLFLSGDDVAKPFFYVNGGPLTVLEGLNGSARGVNDLRQVAVLGYVPGTRGGTNAWRYTPGIGYEPLGTLAGNGEIGDVPNGINNLGQVVGRSDIEERPWEIAFLYTDGVGMVSLGSLSTNSTANAWDINDRGQITGFSGGNAFLYSETTGMVAIGRGQGRAINESGVVAGRTEDYEAAIFENGAIQRLGRLGGDTWANGINDHKVVVGEGFPVRAAFIWSQAEGMTRLNDWVEPGCFVDDAWDINNHGQIAAEGRVVGNASLVALRLDPIPPKLAILATATNRVVSWSPAWPGIVLETTESLGATEWQSLDTGSTNVVTLATEERQRYFRLNLDAIQGLCCPPE